jgi:hypothetical protein
MIRSAPTAAASLSQTAAPLPMARNALSVAARAQISMGEQALQPARMVSDLALFSQGYSLVNAAMRLASRA